jgi:hypothetical protein
MEPRERPEGRQEDQGRVKEGKRARERSSLAVLRSFGPCGLSSGSSLPFKEIPMINVIGKNHGCKIIVFYVHLKEGQEDQDT